MMPRVFKAFEPRYFIIFLIVLATVGVAAAGYIAQGVQYDRLFGLYEQQNTQLRANGIKPTTPSPNQVATQGTAGADGATGARGAQGIPGADGTNGIFGSDGASGAAGATGAPGLNGTNGTNGADGAPGPAGAAGPAGAIPANLTIIAPSGNIYVCTPSTPTVPTYTCILQPAAAAAPAIR